MRGVVEEMGEQFNFKLNEKLTKLDPVGRDYEYLAIKHPIADDIYVVHYFIDGNWDTANYEVKFIEERFKRGYWILL